MHIIAVIGCGRISDAAHFPALSAMEDVRIKYACDLIREKAEEKKEKYPKIENVITDYKQALADPEVETVYVLTPNYAHYTVTMACRRQERFLRKADHRQLSAFARNEKSCR